MRAARRCRASWRTRSATTCSSRTCSSRRGTSCRASPSAGAAKDDKPLFGSDQNLSAVSVASSSHGLVSSGNGLKNVHLVVASHRLLESRLVIADEDVDMPTYPAAVVEDPALEVGVVAFECQQTFRDGCAGRLDAVLAFGAVPK